MLMRSASTPVLGALHPSSSGCHSPAAVSSPAVHFAESPAAAYHPPPISCHLPGSGSVHERSRGRRSGLGMRRTSSEGNLASLAGRGGADDHLLLLLLPPPSGSGKCAPRARPVALETIQSFTVDGQASTDDEQEEEDGYEEPPLFLARGLGSGLLGGGGGVFGGGGSKLVASGDGGGGDHRPGIETHYKTMIEEDPCNGLFLRNYAQFLYQVKGDCVRAEEYYSRAILADPGDGELLSEYAKLVWDVHRDEERAASYFQRAAEASPHNSHVLAAHAAFLWDTDDAEDDRVLELNYAGVGVAPAHSSLAPATT
ncbi:hypothetical protein BS78_03G042500 [Paspalum vaginatum]|nr:hypothetical protein BS78_03G042500 [Paspalum vaginatum]